MGYESLTQHALTNDALHLGVILNGKLSFQPHLGKREAKLSRVVGVQCKLKPFLNTTFLLKLYYAIFHRHLEYGILILGSTFKSHLKQLVLLQNRAVKTLA